MIPNSALRANRLTLAARDMSDVKRYLIAFKELDQLQRAAGNWKYFDHCEALLVAAIVAYCRSFINSESRGKADPLLRPADFDCLRQSATLAALHKTLLKRRHKAIAHADWTEHSTTLIDATNTSSFRRTSVPGFTDGIDPTAFLRLAGQIEAEALAQSHQLDTTGQRGNAA